MDRERRPAACAAARDALDALFPHVYLELRRLARRHLRCERADHTLDTTALVHETYLRLAGQGRLADAERGQVLGLAALAMRRILMDHARRRRALKRARPAEAPPPDGGADWVDGWAEQLLALDEALRRLAELDERLARVVECRYFGGLTEEETAAALRVTARTVRRDWLKARGWLYQALAG